MPTGRTTVAYVPTPEEVAIAEEEARMAEAAAQEVVPAPGLGGGGYAAEPAPPPQEAVPVGYTPEAVPAPNPAQEFYVPPEQIGAGSAAPPQQTFAPAISSAAPVAEPLVPAGTPPPSAGGLAPDIATPTDEGRYGMYPPPDRSGGLGAPASDPWSVWLRENPRTPQDPANTPATWLSNRLGDVLPAIVGGGEVGSGIGLGEKYGAMEPDPMRRRQNTWGGAIAPIAGRVAEAGPAIDQAVMRGVGAVGDYLGGVQADPSTLIETESGSQDLIHSDPLTDALKSMVGIYDPVPTSEWSPTVYPAHTGTADAIAGANAKYAQQGEIPTPGTDVRRAEGWIEDAIPWGGRVKEAWQTLAETPLPTNPNKSLGFQAGEAVGSAARNGTLEQIPTNAAIQALESRFIPEPAKQEVRKHLAIQAGQSLRNDPSRLQAGVNAARDALGNLIPDSRPSLPSFSAPSTDIPQPTMPDTSGAMAAVQGAVQGAGSAVEGAAARLAQSAAPDVPNVPAPTLPTPTLPPMLNFTNPLDGAGSAVRGVLDTLGQEVNAPPRPVATSTQPAGTADPETAAAWAAMSSPDVEAMARVNLADFAAATDNRGVVTDDGVSRNVVYVKGMNDAQGNPFVVGVMKDGVMVPVGQDTPPADLKALVESADVYEGESIATEPATATATKTAATGEKVVGTGATTGSTGYVDSPSTSSSRRPWVDYGSSGGSRSGGSSRGYNSGYSSGSSGGDFTSSNLPAFARASSQPGGAGFDFDRFAAEMSQMFGGTSMSKKDKKSRKGRTSTSTPRSMPTTSGMRASIMRSLAELGLPVQG